MGRLGKLFYSLPVELSSGRQMIDSTSAYQDQLVAVFAQDKQPPTSNLLEFPFLNPDAA
jgi:hypothetical protein